MATQNKEFIKDLIMNIGILFILAGATAAKDENLAILILGLALLVIQTFSFTNTAGKKLVMAEILISLTAGIAAVSHLALSSSFRSPQVFMIITLLGAILVVVEATRKYADL